MLGEQTRRALRILRAHAESKMFDSVLIERPVGTTYNPDTLSGDTTWETVVGCRAEIVERPYSGAEQNLGGRRVHPAVYEVRVPWSVPDILRGYRITVTDSHSTPGLVVFASQDAVGRTSGTRRKIQAEGRP